MKTLSNPGPVMLRAERVAAWLLLINGALGLVVSLGTMLAVHAAPVELAALPLVAILGVLSGCLWLRGHVAGAWAGSVFYALQVVSYYAYSGAWSFSVKSGLSLALVLHLPDGVLVVNVAALALLAVNAVVLAPRLRRRPPVPA